MITGAPLFGDTSGKIRSRSGPIVKDAVGNLLVLCARDLVEGCTVLYQDGQRVGSRPSGFHPTATRSYDPLSLVGWFSIDQNQVIANAQTTFNGFITYPEEIIGDVVVRTPDETVRGNIVGFNAYADFELPWITGDVTIEGLLRVSFHDRDVNFPFGWSGAAVQTNTSMLIGIIIGELEGDALVVPVAPILEVEGLALINERDLLLHNAEVTQRSSEREPLSDMVTMSAVSESFSFPQSEPMRAVFGKWMHLISTPAISGRPAYSLESDHTLNTINVRADLLTHALIECLVEIARDGEAELLETVFYAIEPTIKAKSLLPSSPPKSSFSRVMEG